MAQEKYDEAVSLYRKAIAVKEPVCGTDSGELIPDLHLLARALWREGDREAAQMTMARCVSQTERLLEASQTKPAEGLELKAGGTDEWRLYQGDCEAAVKGFRATLDYEQKNPRIYDPEGMPVWEKLGEAEEALGHAAEAHYAYLRAAEEWEGQLTVGHPRARWCRERAKALPGLHVRHGGHEVVEAGVDGEGAAVVGRVVSDAAENGDAGQAAHDGAGREGS